MQEVEIRRALVIQIGLRDTGALTLIKGLLMMGLFKSDEIQFLSDPPLLKLEETIRKFKTDLKNEERVSFVMTYYSGPAIEVKGMLNVFYDSQNKFPIENSLRQLFRKNRNMYNIALYDCPRPIQGNRYAGKGNGLI